MGVSTKGHRVAILTPSVIHQREAGAVGPTARLYSRHLHGMLQPPSVGNRTLRPQPKSWICFRPVPHKMSPLRAVFIASSGTHICRFPSLLYTQ